jgi:two-component system response regulator PilR (NtrC family)
VPLTWHPAPPPDALIMSALPSDPAVVSDPPVMREPASAARVLVVDDERSMRELLEIVLKREGYEVLVAGSGADAVRVLERQRVDLLISDLRMPDMSGVDVLRAGKQLDPELSAIVVTAFASTDTAVEAMRLGACDYLTKPFDVDELKILVRQTLERGRLRQENVLLKRALGEAHAFSNIIGRSPKMLAVFRLIETIAPTTSTVLVTGESGTGKELAARAIHFNSLRRDKPFVALNCGALPETLLESELFGHMRGAFTGAAVNKKGLLEAAQQGTVFLDEISEMSPLMQVKLLRALQERRFRRVGGTEEIEADIRIIAATNRDLPKEIQAGRFREDLFYRINVIPVHLPPLRERGEDIGMLAEHFVGRFAKQMGKKVTGISRVAIEFVEAYAWPGNIRELENAMERAVALEQTPTVLPDSLPEHVRFGDRLPLTLVSPVASALDLPESGFVLERHVARIERDYIAEALRRCNGVRTKAADLLGMTFRSFRYYAKKYEL